MPLSLCKLNAIELAKNSARHAVNAAQLVVEEVNANLDLPHGLMQLNGLVHQPSLNHIVLADNTLNGGLASELKAGL